MNAVKQASAWLRDQNVRVVSAIILVLVIPAVLTLYTVKVPMKPSDVALNPTPLGYTVSLLIYLVPVLALYRWFCRCCPEGGGLFRRSGSACEGDTVRGEALDYRRSAFRWTLLTLIPIGFLLDIIFGHAFLTFENDGHVLRYPLPCLRLRTGQFPPHTSLSKSSSSTLLASFLFSRCTSGVTSTG